MSLEPDALVDRRRLKRQLGLWRVVAVLAVVGAVVIGVGRVAGFLGRDYVARFTVDGVILEDPVRDATLLAVARDDDARSLIVHISSPGGSVVGGEDLYNAFRKVADVKPVVVVMGTVATSAAYMAAIAGDRIFARQGTVTGSIGVLFQTTEITGLLEKLGVKPEAIKSSPLKAQPSPLEPLTAEGRDAAEVLVLDMYGFFVDLVAERRQLDPAQARILADGRVYTGRQAADNGLIDEIGGEEAARLWLERERGIDRDLPVRSVEVERDEWLIQELVGGLAEKALISEALTLDGLVAVWHPDLR